MSEVPVTFLSATPNLPVFDIDRAVAFYVDRLGFDNLVVKEGYAILRRDDVEIHLWAANKPDTPGAEPSIAGTASCRVRVNEVRPLYQEYDDRGVVHPNGHLAEEPWGELRFTALDPDNNAINFYQPMK